VENSPIVDGVVPDAGAGAGAGAVKGTVQRKSAGTCTGVAKDSVVQCSKKGRRCRRRHRHRCKWKSTVQCSATQRL